MRMRKNRRIILSVWKKALKNELFKCAGMEQRIYIIKELVSNAASLISVTGCLDGFPMPCTA